MGLPIARQLLESGVALHAWNRTAAKCDALGAAGASIVETVDDVFERCEIVMVMVLDEYSINDVLGRDTPAFPGRLQGRTLVLLGTTSSEFSEALQTDVHAAGGYYVEAPVSGSRTQAEEGALVGMLAGQAGIVDVVEPLLSPFCKQVVRCGAVPSALRLKLAVNHYLILLVASLAEAVLAANAAGVDMELFRSILDAGPMASPVSRIKLAKLASRDFSAQASIRDVAQIAALVRNQARSTGAPVPLIDSAVALFADANARGLSAQDMIALHQPASMLRRGSPT